MGVLEMYHSLVRENALIVAVAESSMSPMAEARLRKL